MKNKTIETWLSKKKSHREQRDIDELKDMLGDSFFDLIDACCRIGKIMNGIPIEDEEQDTAVELFDFFKDLKGTELESGYVIADKDYTQAGKNEFTWDEAMDLNKKVFKPNGWHLPTCKEWVEICRPYMNDDGNYDRDKLVKELNLSEDRDGYGFFWSASAYSENFARNLNFSDVRAYPDDYYDNSNRFSIRLVKNKE